MSLIDYQYPCSYSTKYGSVESEEASANIGVYILS